MLLCTENFESISQWIRRIKNIPSSAMSTQTILWFYSSMIWVLHQPGVCTSASSLGGNISYSTCQLWPLFLSLNEINAPLKGLLSSPFVFPADWKPVNDLLILKKSKKEDPRKYRPVSLTSVPGRLWRRLFWGYWKTPEGQHSHQSARLHEGKVLHIKPDFLLWQGNPPTWSREASWRNLEFQQSFWYCLSRYPSGKDVQPSASQKHPVMGERVAHGLGAKGYIEWVLLPSRH